MAGDRDLQKQQIKEGLQRLRHTPIPKGFDEACRDIDLLLFEYDGYIAGLASSFLKGSKINISEIDRASDLDDKLRKCERALADIQSYKQILDELVENLII